jgi:hypothetical protein
VGAEDEVDLVEAAQQGVPRLLGHTAAHREDPAGAGLLPSPQLAQIAIEPMLRLVADRAGIDDQQVGLVQALGGNVALVAKQVRDLLRVVDVHLAPIGAHQDPLRRAQAVLQTCRGDSAQSYRKPSPLPKKASDCLRLSSIAF